MSPELQDNRIVYDWFVAVYLDLQGQKDEIQKLRLAAAPGQESQGEVLQCLQKTVGKILKLRRTFHKQFEVFRSGLPPSRYHNSLSAEQVKELQELRKIELNLWCFSDTIIGYSSVRPVCGLLNMWSVFTMFAACASVMLTAFPQELMLRGGIEVGLAPEFQDPYDAKNHQKEIYGPLLLDAHTLESEVADWPRVVIGHNLVRWLDYAKSQTGTQTNIVLNRELADWCSSRVFPDVDGIYALDYLGQEVARERQTQPHFARLVDAVKQARDYICALHEKYRRAGDRKLALKYAAVRHYYESRLPYWDC